MRVALLTPAGLAVTLVTLVPLAALALTELRARQVRRALGLAGRRPAFSLWLSVTALGLLVGAAAAQPVLERGVTRHERTDVNAYIVIDSTRSMLASPSPRGANRIVRARGIARELRGAVPELRAGVASMTDRVLPHLFPTLDEDVFAATLKYSLGIERPPPSRRRRNATVLASLEQLGPRGFFPATPERRIVVLLSDFETDPFSARRLGAVLRRQRIEPILVHVWQEHERIFGGLGDAGYRPDPESGTLARTLARAAGGRAFEETNVDGAKRALRRLLGDGPSRTLWQERARIELAPWLALAAFLPLGLVLWRRNLP